MSPLGLLALGLLGSETHLEVVTKHYTTVEPVVKLTLQEISPQKLLFSHRHLRKSLKGKKTEGEVKGK